MIAATCPRSPEAHRTESGLQARPLFFNNLQTVLAKSCHHCVIRFRYSFACLAFRKHDSADGPGAELADLQGVNGTGTAGSRAHSAGLNLGGRNFRWIRTVEIRLSPKIIALGIY